METNDKDALGDQSGLREVSDVRQPPPPSKKNLGDTQPFRPPGKYRPLASEAPLEEPAYQQTAPYRPFQQVIVPPKKRSNLSRILGMVALLLVAAAVIAYFALRGSGELVGSLAVERALPANTLGYISISPAPSESQRRAFENMLDVLRAQPGSEEAIANLVVQVRDAISNTGLPLGTATDPATLETLANYLGGNVTIAVLAPSQGDLLSLKPPAGGELNLLAAYDVLTRKVVGLVDLDFSPGSGSTQGIIAELRAVKDNLEKAKVVETYNGTDIRAYTVGPLRLYFALVGGTSTAAVALSSTPVKVVIDELKANKGLKEEAVFKALSAKVSGERVGTLYINAGNADKVIKQLFPESTGILQMDGSLLVSLSGQDDGIQVDIATEASLSLPTTLILYGWSVRLTDVHVSPDVVPSIGTLDDVPANSLAFVVGSDLKSTITYWLDKGGRSLAFDDSNGREAIKLVTGLDLDNDVLAWMGGDYMISVTAPESKSDVAPLVAQIKLNETNRSKATDSIKRGVDTDTNGVVKPIEVAGGTFYDLSNDSAAGTLLGTTANHAMLLFDTSPDNAKVSAVSISANLGRGFGTTDRWKAISSHLLPNSNLIGYLDATALRETTERAITPEEKSDYDKMLAPFLRPIKYVLAGSASEPNQPGEMSRNHTRIFIGISK